jgi:pimeloyl-ACP methyl ester carboxylesterase
VEGDRGESGMCDSLVRDPDMVLGIISCGDVTNTGPRCYASLFTISPFTHTIFVDQAPLQNADAATGWDHRFCNRGMNNPLALSGLLTTLSISPATAHLGTIGACLSYRAFPEPSDSIRAGTVEADADEEFFLGEAMKGDPTWLGKLMADHTALDWRDSIVATLGAKSGSGPATQTQVLVVASSRSGCFPAEGAMAVVGLVNGSEGRGAAQGVVVSWGGHWCYWEDAGRFNRLCLEWLKSGEVLDG